MRFEDVMDGTLMRIVDADVSRCLALSSGDALETIRKLRV